MRVKNYIRLTLSRFSQKGRWSKAVVQLISAPLLWVLLLSGIVRAVYYSVLQNTIAVDTASYLNYSANILIGETEGRRTPLYPYFIKLVGLLGHQNLIDHVVSAQILLSFLSIVVFYKISRSVFKNQRVVFAASLLYGLMLPVINFDKVVITESLSVGFSLVFIYLMVCYLQKPTHVKAWIATLFVFIAIMLRPSFIYLLPLLIVFWCLRLIICKQERKFSLSGLAALVVVVLLLSGYSALNKRHAGFNGISLVGNNNEMAVIVSAGIYHSGSDPEISAALQYNINLEKKYPDRHIPGINIMARFNPDRVHQFIVNCIKNQPGAYLQHIGGKLLALHNANIFTNYADHELSPLAFRIEKIEYLVFNIPFMVLYVVIVVDLMMFIASWIKRRNAPWLRIFLWLIITGQLAVAMMAGYSEYQRLILAAIPVLMIVLFNYVDKAVLRLTELSELKLMR